MFSRNYNFSDGTYGVPDNDSSIAIFREFLQGNIAYVRLSAEEAKTALAAIKNEIEQVNEYSEHLSSQNKRLQDAMATIENRIASAAGIESGSGS